MFAFVVRALSPGHSRACACGQWSFVQQCLCLCCVVVIARADSPVATRIQRFRCRMGMDHRDCSQRIRRVIFQLNLFQWLQVSAASSPTRLPTHARARCTCLNRAFTRPVSCSAHLTWPPCMVWGFRFARLSSRLKLSVCIALKERAAARSLREGLFVGFMYQWKLAN